MRNKKIKLHWIEDSIQTISTGGLLPQQDRFFIRQIKKPAKFGYLLFNDLKNHKLIVHTMKNEQIEYNTIDEIEADNWVLD